MTSDFFCLPLSVLEVEVLKDLNVQQVALECELRDYVDLPWSLDTRWLLRGSTTSQLCLERYLPPLFLFHGDLRWSTEGSWFLLRGLWWSGAPLYLRSIIDLRT